MYAATTDTLMHPNPAAQAAPKDALTRLYFGCSLSSEETCLLITRLVRGELADPTIAALLVALRVKGETEEELIGAAQALKAAAVPFQRPDYLFADTCGSGGDGAGTINISTAAAFVSAAAGLPIAKHGNRSFSSRCGSADVLEHLGANLEASAAVSRRALDQTGFCFLFAPNYHPGLRHAGPARRALGVRTMMNVLGPCVNPASPPIQLIGVSEPKFLEPVAQTLLALGVTRALVVHGAGLDEIALHGPTRAVRVADGRAEAMDIHPEQAGFAASPVEALRGGGPDVNAARLLALLEGKGGAAESQSVALNAGALLMLAGKAADLREGAALAMDTIRSGAGARALLAFAEASRA